MVVSVMVLAVTLVACNNEISNEQKLLKILEETTFAQTEIQESITLPEIDDEVTVTWESSRTEFMSSDGVVTRPTFEEGDVKVFLTLTVSLGEDSLKKIFEFTVLATEQDIKITTVDNLINSIEFETTDLTEDIVIPVIDNDDVTVEWLSSNPALTTEGVVTREDYRGDDVDVTLQVTITYGDYTRTKTFDFVVIKEVKPSFIELDTTFTDALSLDFSYEDKNFIADGYGEVNLVRCVDGDTAVFSEGGSSFTVRFLGINTPESTYKFEPWGKEASDFTCEKLTNANSIVLEYDQGSDARTDGNGRYLAWVWYDGRLLNLELVEEAYTGSKGVGDTKYENTFYFAEFKTQDSDRRIWGEKDPNFDYSLDGVQITIEELVTNQEAYVGLKVVIRGVVARQVGGHPYIVDNGFGIYLYKGFEYTTKLAEGNEVLISGLTLTYYPDAESGAPQLTGFQRSNIEVLSEGNVVEPLQLNVSEFNLQNVGNLVKVLNLTVKSVYENTYDDAFTVTAEDEFGNILSLRRDDSASDDITAGLFTVGTVFDIVGPLGRYSSQYQIMISKLEDITFN